MYALINLSLQGSTLPPTECSDATVDLFSVDDQCTRALHDVIGGNSTVLYGVYFDDCPMRFLNYATACNDTISDEVSNILCGAKLWQSKALVNLANRKLFDNILPGQI